MNSKTPEQLNKDHILAWLDCLHADVQGRVFEQSHSTVHPELCESLAKFVSRFGPSIGIPITLANRKSKRVSDARVRAYIDYHRAIEMVKLLTQICFEEDGPATEALYKRAFPGVINAAMKDGVSFKIAQLREVSDPPGSQPKCRLDAFDVER